MPLSNLHYYSHCTLTKQQIIPLIQLLLSPKQIILVTYKSIYTKIYVTILPVRGKSQTDMFYWVESVTKNNYEKCWIFSWKNLFQVKVISQFNLIPTHLRPCNNWWNGNQILSWFPISLGYNGNSVNYLCCHHYHVR